MRHRTTIALLAVLLVIGACSSDDSDGSDESSSASSSSVTTSTTAVPTEPTGVIAIGHSGLTGLSADPEVRESSAPEYSWATGEAPEINSIYSRLVAADSRHEGHVMNASVNGATMNELVGQVNRALNTVPNPALVILMAVDNDLRCDGTDAENVAPVGESLAAALDVITAEAPEARIVVVGSQNRPAAFADALIAKGEPGLPDGTICSIFGEGGTVNTEGVQTLTAIIEAYEAEMERVCATYEQCTNAIAEAAAAAISADSIAADLQHASIQGHQEIATAVWPVVEEALGL